MTDINNILIHDNGNDSSGAVASDLRKLLKNEGYNIVDEYGTETDLIVCIGGDGTFLRMLRSLDFPSAPIVGFHTGHLGFFQEFLPSETKEFVSLLKNGKYSVQEHRPIYAKITSSDKEAVNLKAINDISVKGPRSTLTHLNLSLRDCFIEHFSGDGLLVSSPAGSTAYNYSLKGCIVDPRIEMMQITPIAPMNTKVFRSFTSSILVPKDEVIQITMDADFTKSGVVVADGAEHEFKEIDEIRIGACDETIRLIRRFDYSFWNTVKSKFF